MSEPTMLAPAGGPLGSAAGASFRRASNPRPHAERAGGPGDWPIPGAILVADARWLDRFGPRVARTLRKQVDELPIVVVGDPVKPDSRRVAREEGLILVDEAGVPESLAALVHEGSTTRATRPGRDAGPAARLREEHEALLQELRLAEQVQRSMLPRSLPNVPGLALGASLRPCRHLAGDFYNAFRLDREHLGLYLGDVMGHGPAAALLGVYTMQVIRTKRIEGNSYEIVPPAEALAQLNRDLIAADFPGSPFVTLAYGVLDVSRRTWTYSSGGHPPALLLRPGRPPESLGQGGPLLGFFEAPFDQGQVELVPGDRLVIYSDGIDGVRWGDQGRGIDGLTGWVGRRDGRTPQELVDAAMAAAVFDDEKDGDDLTLLVAEVLEP